MQNFTEQEAAASLRKIKSKPNTKGLFIDCGANLGQGFVFFNNSYPPDYYDYILIEPNPFCIAQLEILRCGFAGNMEIIEKAADVEERIVRFYGLSETADKTTQGGSIIRNHNSRYYSAQDENAIRVKSFSFAEFLADKQEKYDSIIVKMDIEGAECVVLEDLISKGVHKKVDFFYIEFHSKYLQEPDSVIVLEREKQIVMKLQSDGVGFKLWM
jgi:FkbM family methyltransferase